MQIPQTEMYMNGLVYSITNQIIAAMLADGPTLPRKMSFEFSNLTGVEVSDTHSANATTRMTGNTGYFERRDGMFALTQDGIDFALPCAYFGIYLQGSGELPFELTEVFGRMPTGSYRRVQMLTALVDVQSGLTGSEIALAIGDDHRNIHSALSSLHQNGVLEKIDNEFKLTREGLLVHSKLIEPIIKAFSTDSELLDKWRKLDWRQYVRPAYQRYLNTKNEQQSS